MIRVSQNLCLQQITSSDSENLYNLMQEIYPLAYEHFWEDKGEWYINSQYSKENIFKELSEENTDYYFVIYEGEIIGNFRIIWNRKLEGLFEDNQVKLHRVYLHQKTHGKGIGKKLLFWLEEIAKQKGYQVIWLDAMDEQPQAFQFYKNLGFKYHSHTYLPYELLHIELRKMSQVYKKL